MWFHLRLNQRLWQADHLRLPVRLKLLKTALSFYQFLELDHLIVSEIILTGSNAAYNYTRLSDIDVHLIVNFARTQCPNLADNFFNTKRALWNQTYHTSIYNHPVELYVEDKAKPVTANGIFSLLHNHWIKHPERTAPLPDDTAVEQKADAYADEIDALLAGDPNIDTINEMLDRLRTLRQNGLMAGGEFSVENLAFKMLRSQGYLQRLYDERIDIRVRGLSL